MLRSPLDSLRVGEGNPSAQTVVAIGDKGRSQLTRAESQLFTLSIADTYKVRVTFPQASLIAEELLKQNADAVRIVYNKFRSAISFKPTVATVLSPDVSGWAGMGEEVSSDRQRSQDLSPAAPSSLLQAVEKQLSEPSGSKLDVYELESSHERSDLLRDLSEFQLAAVRWGLGRSSVVPVAVGCHAWSSCMPVGDAGDTSGSSGVQQQHAAPTGLLPDTLPQQDRQQQDRHLWALYVVCHEKREGGVWDLGPSHVGGMRRFVVHQQDMHATMHA